MDSKLAARLSTAEVDRLADEIAEVAANLDAASHRLLSLIRRFDEGSGWYEHGALSCAHWLSWRIGLDLGAAREHVRVARALGALPVLDDALRQGRVSYSKVRAITRVATAENESSLLEMARASTASQLERICRGYRRAIAGLEGLRPEDEAQRRFVRIRGAESGMVRIEAQLGAEEAAMVMKALEVAAARGRGAPSGSDGVSAETPSDMARSGAVATGGDVPAETSRRLTDAERWLSRADALVVVAESYLAGGAAAPGSAPPVELVVHVDESTLRSADDGVATLEDGTAIPRQTAERFACDASVVRVVEEGDGTPLDVGRRTRRIAPALRRALRLRDRGCRFPGCTNRLTDAHHIVAWARGGVTRLGNLCSLCRRHHRFVHEHGYRIEAGSGEQIAFFRRDGERVPNGAGALPFAGDAMNRLRAMHAAAGLAIDASTALPRWDGERVDYDHVVQCLMSR